MQTVKTLCHRSAWSCVFSPVEGNCCIKQRGFLEAQLLLGVGIPLSLSWCVALQLILWQLTVFGEVKFSYSIALGTQFPRAK